MSSYCIASNMDVSENSGTPKSSILKRFSIINHPFWGTPIFGNTHMLILQCPWPFTSSFVQGVHAQKSQVTWKNHPIGNQPQKTRAMLVGTGKIYILLVGILQAGVFRNYDSYVSKKNYCMWGPHLFSKII